MKIAIIGIRGIPVIYSGFESFIEVLAPKLAEKEFDIWVYNRAPYVNKNKKIYKKVNLITLPTLKSKNFESIIHSTLSTLHACLFLKPKVIYYLGLGNSPLTIIPKIFRIKTIINVDGLDWRRDKWGLIAKSYLRAAEYLATVIPDKVITDSKYMHKYYLSKYHKHTEYITYPFDTKLLKNYQGTKKLLAKYKLKSKQYLVWVGRLVPENKVETLIKAFKQIKTNYKCVIIGDDLYENNYKKYIYRIAKEDSRIVRTGFLPRDKYAALLKNSLCYVETKCSGGTHPSLVEATKLSKPVILNNDLFGIEKKIPWNYWSRSIKNNQFETKIIISKYLNLLNHME